MFTKKTAYDSRETLLKKLEVFNIPNRNELKLFKNLAFFDFESIRVNEESYKQTETTTWFGKHVPKSVFISSNLIPENPCSLQRQSSSFHFVFYHCSQSISNSKQSWDEIRFYWSRDCNQNKTVCYTGTTQPKTQPSREVVKFCSWLYRGCEGKRFMYTIPANAKESIIWLTGTIWALL